MDSPFSSRTTTVVTIVGAAGGLYLLYRYISTNTTVTSEANTTVTSEAEERLTDQKKDPKAGTLYLLLYIACRGKMHFGSPIAPCMPPQLPEYVLVHVRRQLTGYMLEPFIIISWQAAVKADAAEQDSGNGNGTDDQGASLESPVSEPPEHVAADGSIVTTEKPLDETGPPADSIVVPSAEAAPTPPGPYSQLRERGAREQGHEIKRCA